MDKNENNEDGIARFIAYQCNKNNLKHFTYDAVEEVIKFSTRICGDKYKLSTQFNKIMEISTRSNNIMVGWLAKSVFFSNKVNQEYQQRGFSYGTHYNDLLEIGKRLSVLYNRNEYIYDNSLTSVMYNHLLYSREIFKGNKYNQEINFSNFIEDIFLQK